MSQENVEAVKAWVEALNRHDLVALLDLADPAIEFRSYLASLSGDRGAYCGHEGLKSYLRDLDDAWEWFRVDADEYRDLGAIVFQLGRLQAKGRSSGLEVEEHFAWLHRFRVGTGPGRYLGVEFFATTVEALEAAGLSE